ncbi:MFS general substrate transporter [Gymnopilus junonius]|uniref:MFS general substrate transporter n=1 Tax=Gymnopilus junonius TaxID=109634 RepID=A0A9P5TIZ2_GYMJU|nr:MFS general substrate transporter [Gymnopilus junonius]
MTKAPPSESSLEKNVELKMVERVDHPKDEHLERSERLAVRKLDLTVLPILTIFYLLSFLDRANIGNARVAGLQKELGLTDNQYEICVTVLFVPYIVAELPSNLLLKRIGPRVVMPTLLTIWGIMVTLQGLVTSFAGLVVVRTLLGLVEGPMFPGIALYLSTFYTRKELGLRIALFFSAASLSGAFSGLLAAAIGKMHGVGGRPGWAWIFILEGLFTVLIGILGFFVLPSTPRDSKFLTDEQKELIMERLERDRPYMKPVDVFSFKEVFRSSLHLTPTKTQLLSVGPFAAGFFVSLIAAFWSDHYQSRGIPAALLSLLAIAGFLCIFVQKTSIPYMALCNLMIPGIYAPVPVITAWMANNSEPHYRRATSVAFGFIATNSGGILSTWRYPTKEGPRFRNTTIMNLTFTIIVVVFSLGNMAYLSWRNKAKSLPGRREEILRKYEEEQDGDEDGLKAWMDLGDQHPDFKYTL